MEVSSGDAAETLTALVQRRRQLSAALVVWVEQQEHGALCEGGHLHTKTASHSLRTLSTTRRRRRTACWSFMSASCNATPVEYQPTTSSLGKTFLSARARATKLGLEQQQALRQSGKHKAALTLVLLLRQECAVYLRHVVCDAVVLDLEAVANLHCARVEVNPQQAPHHARWLVSTQLGLVAERATHS